MDIKNKMSENIESIEDLLKQDKINPTMAVNILISVAEVSFNEKHLNDLDRQLITKALICLKEKVDAGKNFMIKVK
jgi:hypothetical protein